MRFRIPRCYDSHVHLMATGQVALGLQLHQLKSPHDVKNLKIEEHHYRGEWLVGFGWDQHKWSEKPSIQILDSIFPDTPVNFSRTDGHASWFNTKAFEVLGITPPDGTGVLVDTPKISADMQLPPWSKVQEVNFLKKAMQIFNDAGFTHVRDMSGSLHQWNLLCELEDKNELTLYVEENFTCENIKDFDRALSEALIAKKQNRKRLRAVAIKFYTDGALGSEGALLSSGYSNSDKNGELLWPVEDIEAVIEKTWQNNLGVSVHAIGDEAAHLTVLAAFRVQQKGVSGKLNLEHAEVIRDETIALMKELNVTCYMQPCHWLSDRAWLKKKLGPLYENAFPWKKLFENNIEIFWGSDSPIEAASVLNNLKALEESPREGIAKYPADFLIPHSHPDKNWGGECVSEI